MLTYEERVENQARCLAALQHAKAVVKKGDKLRVSKCPGTKRTVTFECWDGPGSCWMVSKSGIDDYHPVTIDRINGVPVDISAGYQMYIEAAKTRVAEIDEARLKRSTASGRLHVPF